MKRIFKDYPERVLGAFVLFVVGAIVLIALITGALGVRHTPAEKSVSDSNPSVVINVNTATEEELAKLDGVSDVIAQRIVRYREENGRFETADDLMNVEGIGEKKMKSIRNYVTTE